jgi:surface antigen
MGNGHPPPGIDTTDSTIDDGTLARIGSPPPGAIGLDSKSGSAKQAAPSIADRIMAYARRQRGGRVGDGQCYTLADRALRQADARSARDYGTITPDADYVWGTSVTLADLQPGDVVQFRDYGYDRETVIERRDETVTRQDSQDRAHHTAIVQSVDGNGAVTVWEQNAPDGSPVTRTQLFFTSGTTTHGNERTTIRVRGTFWFYRPVAQ